MTKKKEEQSELVLAQNNEILVPTEQNMPLGLGHEDMDEDDEITIPRVLLIQFSSDLAKRPEKDPMHRNAGLIVNSVTKEVLPAKFIPIFKTVNFVRWNGRNKNDPNFDSAFKPGQLIFSTRDRRDPRVIEGKDFGPNGEPPVVTKYLEFMCLFEGSRYPAILSFAKTSARVGADFNTLTKMKGGNRFDHAYNLGSVLEQNDSGSFYRYQVTYDSPASPAERAQAKFWYDMYKDRQQLKVHDEHEETASASSQNWSE